MKSFEYKAKKFFIDNVNEWTTAQEKALVVLLKEQDRDTRHACAEAVLECEEDASGECIWKNEAHSACMNSAAG